MATCVISATATDMIPASKESTPAETERSLVFARSGEMSRPLPRSSRLTRSACTPYAFS